MIRTTATSRGLRNCNPGNIRRVKGQDWKGQTPLQTDPTFVTFYDEAWGYRAMMVILANYRRKGVCRIEDIVRRWAPPSENDTAAYIASVCTQCDCTPRCIPDLTDRETMVGLVEAMARVENGVPAIHHKVEAGWELYRKYGGE